MQFLLKSAIDYDYMEVVVTLIDQGIEVERSLPKQINPSLLNVVMYGIVATKSWYKAYIKSVTRNNLLYSMNRIELK
ncbi:hypothetical protein [Candidatus Coxiella mudrowiae]|uniref:hypothetical protein n=1 Tax=Candidatus Coxiella mudrowiae TaxID=2054173 RepID=UPI0006621CE6|nr:hypothetical protein [Candidatus Coxiella mudrowiae]